MKLINTKFTKYEHFKRLRVFKVSAQQFFVDKNLCLQGRGSDFSEIVKKIIENHQHAQVFDP